MKKLVLLAWLALSILPIYAQTSACTADSRIAVGIVGGYNENSIRPNSTWKALGYNLSSGSGWRAGLIADKRLWKKWYLQPQLLLNEKGYNSAYLWDVPPTYADSHLKTRLLYLELQANFLFKQQVGNGKIFAGAGPYIARGISGLQTSDGQYYDSNIGAIVRSVNYSVVNYRSKRPGYAYGNVLYVKPYDMGLNVLAGYELKNDLFFNAVYSLELNNNGFDKHHKNKNTWFGVTAGYFLRRFS